MISTDLPWSNIPWFYDNIILLRINIIIITPDVCVEGQFSVHLYSHYLWLTQQVDKSGAVIPMLQSRLEIIRFIFPEQWDSELYLLTPNFRLFFFFFNPQNDKMRQNSIAIYSQWKQEICVIMVIPNFHISVMWRFQTRLKFFWI